jgi:hypothetical protein
MPVIPLLFLMIDFKTIFNDTKLKVIFKIIIVMSILFQLLSISINSNSFLAFCKKNNLIYKNTHDLPKISSLKGQYFLIEQNIREFFGMKDLFINGKNLNGYGETMFWQLHLFRFYKSRNLNIFIFIFCFIHLYIITRLFIFIKIQIIEKT